MVEHRSTIDYPYCPWDDHEWYAAEFRKSRASRDPCFIVDLSVLNSFNPHLSANILWHYALEFEVRVESIRRDLRECLIEAIRDRDYCRELLDATVEDYDKIGRAYDPELATLRVKEFGSFSYGGGVYSVEIPGH